MFRNRKLKLIQAYFDGAPVDTARAQQLLAEDPACAAHWASLQAMRRGARQQAPQEITDIQMNAFLSGIREQISAPAPQTAPAMPYRRSIWAGASLAAAALLAAVSALYIVSGDSTPVRATEVEMHSTDILGATTGVEYGPNGGATIWINLTGDDL
jgi:anti-sigma factor RsiW